MDTSLYFHLQYLDCNNKLLSAVGMLDFALDVKEAKFEDLEVSVAQVQAAIANRRVVTSQQYTPYETPRFLHDVLAMDSRQQPDSDGKVPTCEWV